MPAALTRDWMTTGEMARLLRWSQQTAIRLLDDGVIPSWRIGVGQFRRALRKDVEEYARANKIPLADPAKE